ncbi:hypothetical protein F5883DRAFT_540965 [Diaporthe sp. PMI_573]|nr:hypothetical protein F5883DRAFT_540965 [Diaporthaceae sp. PMI_573]
MILKLQEIDQEVDFHAISRCLFESHEDPPQKFFHLWFPIHGNDEQARENAIEEGATRLKLWHTEDPSSNWRKVVDTESGRIAGAALWNIHHENPFAVPDDLEVTWFPEGGSREFVEQMITQYDAPRAEAAQKPHVYLFVLFTHPDYRRKGVGQQLLNWGVEKADELRLDIFLDSTSPGRPLYEANGFSYLQENHIRPKKDHADHQWQEVEKKVGAITFWPMKRPASQGEKRDKVR